MSDNEILIPFAQGVAQQGDSLTDTVQRTQAWLNTLDLEAMRRSALLFAGIGASYAVLASPVHELRAAGIRAFRSNGDDMPTGTPVLADWYIGVSQSGRSPEVVRILQQQRHGRRLTIVNQARSPLERISGQPLWLGTLIDSSMSSVALMATSVSLGLLTDALIGRDETAGWLTLPQTLAAQRPSADAVIARFVARLNNPGLYRLGRRRQQPQRGGTGCSATARRTESRGDGHGYSPLPARHDRCGRQYSACADRRRARNFAGKADVRLWRSGIAYH